MLEYGWFHVIGASLTILFLLISVLFGVIGYKNRSGFAIGTAIVFTSDSLILGLIFF